MTCLRPPLTQPPSPPVVHLSACPNTLSLLEETSGAAMRRDYTPPPPPSAVASAAANPLQNLTSVKRLNGGFAAGW